VHERCEADLWMKVVLCPAVCAGDGCLDALGLGATLSGTLTLAGVPCRMGTDRCNGSDKG